MPNKCSDADFAEAVLGSTTWKEVKERLGHTSEHYKEFADRCMRLAIPFDHIQPSSRKKISDHELLEAVKNAPSAMTALKSLGLPPSMSYYDRLRALDSEYRFLNIKSMWDIEELRSIAKGSKTSKQFYENAGVKDQYVQKLLREFCFKNNVTIPGQRTFRLIDNSQIKEVIAASESYREVARKLKLSERSHRAIKRFVRLRQIDVSHFLGQAHMRGKTHTRNDATPLEEVLVRNSTYNRQHLKRRLIREKILRNECYICGSEPMWREKPLALRLDHTNGINNDNRIENLRLLCPNCDSQSEYFSGRNVGRQTDTHNLVFLEEPNTEESASEPSKRKRVRKQGTAICSGCEAEHSNLKYCSSECSHLSTRKVARPSKEQLLADLQVKSFLALGRQYGVSDNAVRKWAKGYGIETNGLPRRLEKRPSSLN